MKQLQMKTGTIIPAACLALLACSGNDPGHAIDSESGNSTGDSATESGSDTSVETDSDSRADTADTADTDPETQAPICLTPGAGPYPLLFVERTADFGLDADGLNVVGGNIVTADVNGDGWPDLLVSRGSSLADHPDAPRGEYRLLLNDRGIAFSDATWSSGLYGGSGGTPARPATFTVLADVDNDGDMDALSVVFEDDNTGVLHDRTAVHLNAGDGTFAPGPALPLPADTPFAVQSATFLDYDLDGNLDIYFGGFFSTFGQAASATPDRLFRGDGTGAFVDVTGSVGIMTLAVAQDALTNGTAHRPTWGVTACDLDGDGWMDLLSAAYGRGYNLIWRNPGTGTFENVSLSSGLASDDNIDFSDNLFFRSWCLSNETDPLCEGVDLSGLEPGIGGWTPGFDDQPFRNGGNTSNLLCGDLNNDGALDVVRLEIAHWHIGASSDRSEILYNAGFPTMPFERPGNASTGMTRVQSADWNDGDLSGVLADFDNDGRLDILVAASDYPDNFALLWQQQPDGSFIETAGSAGVRIPRAHGVSLVDFDRDGDYDLVTGTSLMRWTENHAPPRPETARVRIFENRSGDAANRVIIELEGDEGSGANRQAIGARITVHAGNRRFVREVSAAHGLQGLQHDSRIIIGIGDLCEVDRIHIRWPGGIPAEEEFSGVLPNHVTILKQGRPMVQRPL